MMFINYIEEETLPRAPSLKTTFPGALLAALFLLESLSVAAFVWLKVDARRGFLSLVVLSLAAAVALAGLVAIGARFLSRRTGRAPAAFAPALIVRLAPFVFLDLVFLQFVVFLRDIRPVLPWVSVLGSAYLLGVFVSRTVPLPPPATVPEDPRRRLPALFAASFLVYAFLASGLVVPPQPFSGDEPHYLLITQSLLADGDIDVFNDYRGERYRVFYPGPLENHAYPGKRPDHEYSRHLPGISILVLPSYLAGELAGKALAPGPGEAALRARILVFVSRLPMFLLAAALGAVFFLLALRVTGRPGPSLLAWAVFSFTSPLVYYSQLIFPELPVALIAILIFLFIILEKEPRPAALWLAGIGISVLPWFGIKYLVISAALFALCSLPLSRAGKRGRSGLLSLVLPAAVSGIAYLYFFRALYGTFSPAAAYGDSFSSSHIDHAAWSTVSPVDSLRFGFGYLFDQRFGIIPHSLLYILMFAGAIMLLRRVRKAAIPAIVLFVAYWALCAVVRVWGGYCPPGRLLLPALWVPALFVAEAFAAEGSRARRAIRNGAIGLGLAAAFAGVCGPRLLYNENIYTALSGPGTFNKLLSGLSNSFVDFRLWVPSFANWKVLVSPATAVWLLGAAGLTYFFVRKRKADAPDRRFGQAVHTAIVLGLSLVIMGYAFFNVRLDAPVPAGGGRTELFFQDGNTHGMEPDGFWTRGGGGATVLVGSPKPLSRISLTLSSPIAGRTIVRAGMIEKVVVREGRDRPPVTLDLDAPVGYRLGGRYYYSLWLRDSASFIPFKLDRHIGDDRKLGIHAAVSAR